VAIRQRRLSSLAAVTSTLNRRRVSALAAATLLAVTAPAGCGSGSGAPSVPQVAPARVFSLSGFQPQGPVVAGRAVPVSFTVDLPSGQPLTQYRTGPGPHTGVHLIIVRDDLAYIIHEHPPVGPNGGLLQNVTFPASGPYHVLVDIYPSLPGTLANFQLVQGVRVAGAYHAKPLPRFDGHLVVDGYHFDMQGQPKLHAIQPTFLHVEVTDASGRKVTFVPWFGALAHAIFFRQGSLDYFHTHICAPNALNCGALAGVRATAITGRSAAPGQLTIGALVPTAGTWELFLQMKLHGQIVTAPFTLHVSP
jgi:hypothetical protein